MLNKEKRIRKATAKARRKERAKRINNLYPPPLQPSYLSRNVDLLNLGFNCYSEYLLSPLWDSIRCKVIRGQNCRVCRSRIATQVHHMSYSIKVLTGENLVPLWPVCRTCHYRIEFESNGRKRTFVEAQGAAQRLSSWAKKGKLK